MKAKKRDIHNIVLFHVLLRIFGEDVEEVDGYVGWEVLR